MSSMLDEVLRETKCLLLRASKLVVHEQSILHVKSGVLVMFFGQAEIVS